MTALKAVRKHTVCQHAWRHRRRGGARNPAQTRRQPERAMPMSAEGSSPRHLPFTTRRPPATSVCIGSAVQHPCLRRAQPRTCACPADEMSRSTAPRPGRLASRISGLLLCASSAAPTEHTPIGARAADVHEARSSSPDPASAGTAWPHTSRPSLAASAGSEASKASESGLRRGLRSAPTTRSASMASDATRLASKVAPLPAVKAPQPRPSASGRL